ncbi:MAG: indole-3-glycerol phosphate synthase TrpC [Thermodesulfobacteriota bacterium]
MILERILEAKREWVSRSKRLVPISALEEAAKEMGPTRDFEGAIMRPGLALITEIKRRSPSKGWIRKDADPLEIARVYEENGAAAISVLTDQEAFGGHDRYLPLIKGAVDLPLLRKEFILDPYQVFESRALGADAILLIAGLLSHQALRGLILLAETIGLSALVEVHTREELDKALAAGAKVIGINNRDLRTFSTDLTTTAELAPHVPQDRVLVSESGIRTRADIETLLSWGVKCCLMGETLMAARDIGAKLRELLGRGGTGHDRDQDMRDHLA